MKTTMDGVEEKKEVLPGHVNIQSYATSLFRAVLATSRTTNVLPAAGNDFDFYQSFSGFQEAMNLEGDRLLELMTQIMKYQGAHNCRMGNQKTANDIEEKTDALIDANDLILERVNNLVDEASGKKKTDPGLVVASLQDSSRPAHRIATWNRATAGVVPEDKLGNSPAKEVKLLAGKNVTRPQLAFKDFIDNSATPFACKLRHKPHSKSPFLGTMSSDIEGDQVHPYKLEIQSLVYPPHQLGPIPEPLDFPEPIAATPYKIVNSVAGLVSLLEALEKVDCFAVDLEAHSFRSFQGLTCLMQISTQDHDWVVDVLVPEVRQELQRLNLVFANPEIVKFFHGADWDIQWLQRDFGIFVVNLFDTYQAAKVLELSRHSLAFLLLHYCGVETNKKYQLADWRIRPLPDELLNYARTDTHFLIYIASRMKNELLSMGPPGQRDLARVLSESSKVCLQLYNKPTFDPEGYRSILFKHKKSFNSQQEAALASLFAWRDSLARQEDESVGYVLPNHMMISIAEVLPREPNGILACCNPLPPLVKQQLNEIHRLVVDARDVALIKPIKDRMVAPIQKTYSVDAKYNSEKLLQCPIDSSHVVEEEADVGDNRMNVDVDDAFHGVPKLLGIIREATEKNIPTLNMGKATSTLSSSSLFDGGTSMIIPGASAADKAAAIHASILSPFVIFLPATLEAARIPLGVPLPPKWNIRMVKKSSKLLEIQRAAEQDRKRRSVEETEAEKAKRAKMEATEKKDIVPLSALKELEEEQAKRDGIVKKKKKKKTIGETKKGEFDASDIAAAKAKLFRESKKEVQVLGKRNNEDVIVDQDQESESCQTKDEPLKKKKKKEKKAKPATSEIANVPSTSSGPTEITPFDYSKADVRIFSKGLDKKKAEEAQINPQANLQKKKEKKKGLKKSGKQHFGGKDSFTVSGLGPSKKGSGGMN